MLRNDIRYALRLMRRSPGFTAVAVLSLALGIGVNTAIYSLFYTVMLRQLPVAHPEQLVELVRAFPGRTPRRGYWGWEPVRVPPRSQSRLLGDHGHGVRQSGPGAHTEGSDAGDVDPGERARELLSGARAEAGDRAALPARRMSPASGEGDVVVVSWSYWNRRFHRDPAILGKRIYYQ